MPTDIDSLNLKITADASSAAKSIDKLSDSLSNLGRKLGPSTVKNLGQIGSAIDNINTATGRLSVKSIERVVSAFKGISTAVGSVDKFVGSLGKLNSILEGYSATSKYTKNIEDISVSFGNLAAQIQAIDGGKIKELAASIRSFAYSTTKLSDILSHISFTDAGAQAKHFSQTVQDAAKDIAGSYGIIDDAAQTELRSALATLADASKETNSFSIENSSDKVVEAFMRVSDVVRRNAAIADQSKQVYKDLLAYIAQTNASGSKILLPFNGQAEFRDAYSSMRSTLGKAFTSDATAGATQDITRYVEEMNQAIGTTIDTTGNAADTFRQLYEMLIQARTGTIGYDEALQSGLVDIGQFEYQLNSFMQTLQQENGGLGSVENVFKSLAEGLQALGNVNIPDSENLAALVSAISKFGLKAASIAPENISKLSGALMQLMNALASAPPVSSGVTTLIQSVANMTEGLRGFAGSASSAASGLKSFSSALSHIGGKSAEGIQKISRSMTEIGRSGSTTIFGKIASAIQRLGIAEKISNGVKKIAQHIGSLAKGLASRAASAIKKLADKLNIFGKAAKNATGHGKGLASMIGSLYARFWLLKRAFEWGKQAVEVASDLVEVQNVVNKTFGEATGAVDAFAKSAIEGYGMSELSAKTFASRFQAMGTALGYGQKEMANYSITLTQLAGDMASFYNKDYEDTAKALESIFTGQSKPLRAYGVDITETTLKEWAMNRGMNANIETMTQAQKVMLRYQYVLERLAPIQGDFVQTIDSWANQTRLLQEYLKVLMTQVGSTLINIFKPVVKVLNNVLKYVIDFVKTVGDALGTIFGWTVETTNTGVFNDFEEDIEPTVSGLDNIADAADKGAKALEEEKEKEEELARSVLGFDELNKLSPEKEEEETNAPDADAVKGANDAADAFNNLAGAIDDVGIAFKPTTSIFESSIDTLYKLGKYIGDTLRETLESINWDEVYKGAENFGTGLAEFLNGLISPELFAAIGKTIGNSLNTVLHGLNAFAYTFDFKNLGDSIAAGLKALADSFDADLFKDTLGRWGKGIAQTLNGIFDPDTAGSIGNALAEGINGVFTGLNEFAKEAEWKKWGLAVNKGLQAFFDAMDMDLIIETLGNLGGGIADFLNGLADVTLWQKVGSNIAGWLNAFVNFFKEFGEKLEWEKWGAAVNTGVETLIKKINWGAMQSALVTWGSGIAAFLNNFVTPSLGGSGGKAISTLMNNFMGGLNALGKHLDWKNLGASIQAFVNSALENFDWQLLGTTISTWANGFFDLAKGFFAGLSWDSLFNGLRTALSSITWSEIATNAIDAIWTALSGKNMDAGKREEVLTAFSGLETTLGNIADFVFSGLESLYNDVLEPLAGWMLSDGVTAFANIVTNQFSNVDWDKLKDGVANLASALGSFGEGVFKGFTGFIEQVSKFPLIGILLNLLADGLDALFGKLDGRDHASIKNIGEAVGGMLGAIALAKLTMGVVTTIKSLAAATALPALLSAIVAHPAFLIIAGGAAVALAINSLAGAEVSLNSLNAEKLDDAAAAIANISDSLAKNEIDAEGDYKYITGILDKYMELNQKLIETGSLTPEEQSLFEWYAKELESYSDGIITKTTEIGEAYSGTKEELEKLLEIQYEQIKQDVYRDYLYNAQTEIAKAEIALEGLRKEIGDAVLPVVEDFVKKTNINVDLNYNSEDFQSLIDYLADGGEHTDLLTDNMYALIDTVYAGGGGGVLGATQDLMAATSDLDDKVGGLTQKYSEGVTDIEKAKTAYDNVRSAIEKSTETTSESTGTISTAWETLKTKATEFKDDLSTKFGTMKDNTKTKFDEMVEDAKTLGDSIGTKIKEMGDYAKTQAAEGVQGMTEKVQEKSPEFESAVQATVDTADTYVAGFSFDMTDYGKESVNNLSQGVTDNADTAYRTLDDFSAKAYETINPKSALRGSGTSAAVKELNEGVHIMVREDMVGAVDGELGIENGSSSVMSKRGEAAIKGMKDGATTEEPNLFQKFLDLPKTLTEKLGNVKETFSPYGKDSITGIGDGSGEKMPDLLKTFELLPDDLTKKMGDVKSDFKLIGFMIPTGIHDGVKELRPTLETYIDEVRDGIPGRFSKELFFDVIWKIGHDMMDTLKNGMDSFKKDVITNAEGVRDSMIGAFDTLGTSMYNIGKNAVENLRNGWTSTHIPMPNFSSWNSFITVGDKTVAIPHFSVNWAAKGAFAYGPSIMGIGEAGKEAVLPLENPRSMSAIAEAITSQGSLLDEDVLTNAFVRAMAITGNGQNGSQNQILNVVVKTENDEVLARAVTRGQRSIDYRNNPVSKM